MKTIAIDLDSVLADVMIIWIEEYNRIRGSNIIKNDITVWDIHNILPINEIECNILFSMVWKNRWKEIPPTNKNIEKSRLHTKNKILFLVLKIIIIPAITNANDKVDIIIYMFVFEINGKKLILFWN